MSGVKHTPGPWMVAPEYGESHGQFSILDSDGAEVASAEAWICEHRAEAQANARLIAAAPELLDALEAVRDSAAWFDLQASEQAVVSAAIAKATGGEA